MNELANDSLYELCIVYNLVSLSLYFVADSYQLLLVFHAKSQLKGWPLISTKLKFHHLSSGHK
jgi:hypothetical protein